jgi:hypothetical protein
VTARPLPVDDRASALATRRDELLARLPRRLGAARALALADRELVVDDAIAYTVMEHHEPLRSPDEVERVFWTACEIRVKRTLDGRHSMIRNGLAEGRRGRPERCHRRRRSRRRRRRV